MLDRVITVALFPFYLIGLVAGGLVFVVLIVSQAVVTGFRDGKRS